MQRIRQVMGIDVELLPLLQPIPNGWDPLDHVELERSRSMLVPGFPKTRCSSPQVIVTQMVDMTLPSSSDVPGTPNVGLSRDRVGDLVDSSLAPGLGVNHDSEPRPFSFD